MKAANNPRARRPSADLSPGEQAFFRGIKSGYAGFDARALPVQNAHEASVTTVRTVRAALDTVADLLSPVDESSGRLLRAYPLLSIIRGALTLVWRDAWALVKAHRAGVIFAVTLLAAVSAAHILGRVGAA